MEHDMKSDWDAFLEIGKGALNTLGDIRPIVMLVKQGATQADKAEAGVCLIDARNGQELAIGLRQIVKKKNPDYFILQMTGWGTKDNEALDKMHTIGKKIADMPDKLEFFIQIMVIKDGTLVKAKFFEIKREGSNGKSSVKLIPEEFPEGVAETHFAFAW